LKGEGKDCEEQDLFGFHNGVVVGCVAQHRGFWKEIPSCAKNLSGNVGFFSFITSSGTPTAFGGVKGVPLLS
jgi:hypothetical protein